MLRHAALTSIVALVALPAHAELVEVDLLAPGDALVTRDTATGLDWLDLGGVTTGLSYDAVIGGAGGWVAGGWRHATRAEVCALFVAHGGVPSCSYASSFTPAPSLQTLTLQFMLGITESAPAPGLRRWLRGVYDDGTAPVTPVGVAALDITGLPVSAFAQTTSSANDDAAPSSEALGNRGHFLVRATPSAVPALPPAGVAALAAGLALAARRLRHFPPHSRSTAA